MASSTLRFPAGPASVAVALPHRLPAATAPSRLPATVAMVLISLRYPGLISSSSSAIHFTPVSSATRFDVLRARRTDGEDDVSALPEIDGAGSAFPLQEIDAADGATSALPHSDFTASAVSEVDSTASTLTHSDSTSPAVPEIYDTVSKAPAPPPRFSAPHPPPVLIAASPAFPTPRAPSPPPPPPPLSLLGWILKVAKERFSGDSILLPSLLALLIGGYQTTYFKEAEARRIEGSMRVPPCVLTIFTFCAAVATLLYKAAKASKELHGIVSLLVEKFEKLLESHGVKTQSEKLPEPREAKSQASR